MDTTKPVEAQAKLDLAVAAFEKMFNGRIWTFDPNSKSLPAYAPVQNRHETPFVEHVPAPRNTDDEAIAAWSEMALAEAAKAPEGSTLYWRVRPEIAYARRSVLAGGNSGWITYSRFVISDKPRTDSHGT